MLLRDIWAYPFFFFLNKCLVSICEIPLHPGFFGCCERLLVSLNRSFLDLQEPAKLTPGDRKHLSVLENLKATRHGHCLMVVVWYDLALAGRKRSLSVRLFQARLFIGAFLT